MEQAKILASSANSNLQLSHHRQFAWTAREGSRPSARPL